MSGFYQTLSANNKPYCSIRLMEYLQDQKQTVIINNDKKIISGPESQD